MKSLLGHLGSRHSTTPSTQYTHISGKGITIMEVYYNVAIFLTLINTSGRPDGMLRQSIGAERGRHTSSCIEPPGRFARVTVRLRGRRVIMLLAVPSLIRCLTSDVAHSTVTVKTKTRMFRLPHGYFGVNSSRNPGLLWIRRWQGQQTVIVSSRWDDV